MNESTELTTATLPSIKSIVLAGVDVTAYQATVLREAQQRLATRLHGIEMAEAEKTEAQRGFDAAEYADIPTQMQLWRERYRRADYRIRRRQKTVALARKFLSLVEDGYLPIPTLPGANPLWILRDPLPPEVLETLGVEQTHGRFQEFVVVGAATNWEPARSRHRDPILIGICDGEMFPLAWWR